jgi:exosortase A
VRAIWRKRLQPLSLVAVAAAFLLLYGRVFLHLARNWANDANYSHGFLVLPIALYLVWERRNRLRAIERRPAAAGLLLVIGNLIVFMAGTAAVEFTMMRLSAIGVVAGIVLFLAGWQWLRVLLLPLAFTLLMIPVPPIVFDRIALPLQLLASRFGVAVLQLLQIPVLREGNVIELAHAKLEVAEACSGIRSLVSLFTLAVLYGYFSDTRAGRRILIALSSIPIAIVANGVRVAGTGIAAQYAGATAAEGFFHTFAGAMIFIASAAMLLTVAGVLRTLTPAAVRRSEPSAS